MKSEILTLPRRRFLKSTGLIIAGSLILPKLSFGSNEVIKKSEKKLTLFQPHTGEHFNEVFYAEGELIPDAMKTLKKFLRDWRTDDEEEMCPELIMFVHDIQNKMEAQSPLNVFSAYRCPKTNEKLRKKSKGVAKKSYHLTGHAIDFNVPGRSLRKVRDFALSQKKGGVGYYGKGNFIHIDIREKPAQW